MCPHVSSRAKAFAQNDPPEQRRENGGAAGGGEVILWSLFRKQASEKLVLLSWSSSSRFTVL